MASKPTPNWCPLLIVNKYEIPIDGLPQMSLPILSVAPPDPHRSTSNPGLGRLFEILELAMFFFGDKYTTLPCVVAKVKGGVETVHLVV